MFLRMATRARKKTRRLRGAPRLQRRLDALPLLPLGGPPRASVSLGEKQNGKPPARQRKISSSPPTSQIVRPMSGRLLPHTNYGSRPYQLVRGYRYPLNFGWFSS